MNFIETNTVISIPTDYATPLAALQYLMGYIIAPGITVTINVDAGDYTHNAPLPKHPQGSQISILGASATFPVESDFVITGNSVGARATDNANHLTMLQGKFPTRIYCGAVSFLEHDAGQDAPTISDLLIHTDTGVNVGYRLYSGIGYMTRVAFHGFGSIGICLVNAGQVRGDNVSVSGCNSYGVQSSDASDFKLHTCIFASNANSGILVKRGGIAEIPFSVSKGNGGRGFLAEDNGMLETAECTAKGNLYSGFAARNGGQVTAIECLSDGNGVFGFEVYGHGKVIASSSIAQNNANVGFSVDGIGTMYAKTSQALNNSNVGYKVAGLGRLSCLTSTSTGNTGTHTISGQGLMDKTGSNF